MLIFCFHAISIDTPNQASKNELLTHHLSVGAYGVFCSKFPSKPIPTHRWNKTAFDPKKKCLPKKILTHP